MLQTRSGACFFEAVFDLSDICTRTTNWFVYIFDIGDILGHYQVRSPRMRRRNVELAYCKFVRLSHSFNKGYLLTYLLTFGIYTDFHFPSLWIFPEVNGVCF